MSRHARNALIAAAAVPVALVLMALVVFGFDRAAHRGQVLRNVDVNGLSLDGMDEATARRALLTMEAELAAEPAFFDVDGTSFSLLPSDVGFDIDADAVVAAAMAEGRSGSLPSQFVWWFSHLRGSTVDLQLSTSVDGASVEAVVARWEDEAVAARVSEGGVEIRDNRAVPVYPVAGRAIDRAAAERLVRDTMRSLVRPIVTIPIAVVQPTLTPADVDAAVEEANLILAGPVVLERQSPQVEVTFTREQLAAAFRSEVQENSEARIELTLDRGEVERILAPIREDLILPPGDASFRVNADDTVTLLPGHPGTILDPAQVTEALLAAARSPSRRGEFPFVEGVEPDFTTEEAEAMMPITLVSEFTTKHNCCERRVTNIQRFADIVDGTIVWPGETLSLNQLVGRRTTDKGFVPAPMIQGGELVDDVGGGVSQFATTFYNAVFFGGYEDVEHSPHSIYISRYPVGREATISWPAPDLKFRNNTDAVVIIKTEYTDRSITVKFFGNNGGIHVDSVISDRYNPTNPVERYEADSSVEPGSERIKQSGSGGFSVTVKRIITYPDGRPEKVEEWRERYIGAARIILKHPCELPGGHHQRSGACPVKVPPLGGLTAADAKAIVEGAGFVFALGAPVPVTIESGLHGLVAAHTTGFASPGSTVTVQLGEAPTPPPTSSTTTTSTTTTMSGSSSTSTTSTTPSSTTTSSSTTTTTTTTTTTSSTTTSSTTTTAAGDGGGDGG